MAMFSFLFPAGLAKSDLAGIESKLDKIGKQLDQVLSLLGFIKATEEKQVIDITKLTQDVASQSTVVDSAVALLEGLYQAIADLKAQTTDPAVQAALDQLATQVEQNTQKWADAVVANTPAA